MGGLVPDISDNPGGWGPSAADVPQQFVDIPYAQYNLQDRVGRAADWMASQQGRGNKYNNYGQHRGEGVATEFQYVHSVDEDSFHVVDTKQAPKAKQYGRRHFGQRGQRSHRESQFGKHRRQRWGNRRWDNRNTRYREASIEVRPDWTVVDQVNFSALSKLAVSSVPEAEDLGMVGSLAEYDKAYDRVTPKQEKKLRKTTRSVANSSASEDPKLVDLAAQGVGNVIATQEVLVHLLACTRSTYSWDIVVEKKNGVLFLNKRPDSKVSTLSCNETAHYSPSTDDKMLVNQPEPLAAEATGVNASFIAQVTRNGEGAKSLGAVPFAADDADATALPHAYRYRKWQLDDDTTVVVRCDIDAVTTVAGKPAYVALHALNEFDIKSPGEDWRHRYENQPGAVLVTEAKNNAFRLGKVTGGALLSGCTQLKLGFVVRETRYDAKNHAVLKVKTFKPHEFAAQTNLKPANMWAILEHVVGMLRKLDDGKYLIMRDTHKAIMRIYQVPQVAFTDADVQE